MFDPIMLNQTSSGPAAFAGLDLSEPRLMGIVNVTPDSFSDGGQHADHDAAIAHGRRLAEEGAHILDVGGESTRPGAQPVSVSMELDRVLPVIETLAADGFLVSADTRRAEVMAEALKVGAGIINDVSAMGDADGRAVAAEHGCGVILMHMKGTPETMQKQTQYDDVVAEVIDFLKKRIALCLKDGIEGDRIAVDPGIGFAKTVEQNVMLLGALDRIQEETGRPVLVGVSRKSFIGRLSRGEAVDQRLAGSIAGVIAAYAQGVRLFRVHDVAETRQALDVWEALKP